MDKIGLPVENFKLKDGVPSLLTKIRSTQKKMREFQKIKLMLGLMLNSAENKLASQGQALVNSLPGQPMRNLADMNFGEVEESNVD